ncbi:MAG: ParA family protein [Sphingomonas sp.]|nr:MAG: ParA family protein [Sphingomonas sp.]
MAHVTPSDLTSLLGGITLQGVYKQLRQHEAAPRSLSNRRRWVEPADVRRLLEGRDFTYPHLNIAFQIVKGGTGKTSLAYALATRASHYGVRVLAIDFDQQGNLTRSFNVDARERPVWLHVVRDRLDPRECIIEVSETLHLLPSNLNNSRLDIEVTSRASNLRDMLRDKLETIRSSYDLVVMDCPPAINKMNTAVTCGADLIIIPVNPDPYAIDGLDFTLAELDRIKVEFKVRFDHQVVWNRYDARERLGMVYMHELAKSPTRAAHLLPVVIRTDTSVKNAIFQAKSVFDLPKRSAIQDDIDQFTREILGLNQWKEDKQAGVA